jgi:hypothetical protein
MGQKDSVYRKSTEGAAALARRDPSLTPRLRSLLILVDGKRSTEELVRMAPTGTETEALLAHLESAGMLERAFATTEPAPLREIAQTPAPAEGSPAPIQTRTVPLAQAQRAAARRLTDLLGPEAETLCLRIESARTAQDLAALLQRAEAMVRSARGADAATAFTRHMQAYRPA